MKAVVLAGIRKIEIVEQPAPALQYPTDVLLRIIRVGICGSDMHFFDHTQIQPGSGSQGFRNAG
jgi:L-iditol 2-dehydrogenase